MELHKNFSCPICGSSIESKNIGSGGYAYCSRCDVKSVLRKLSKEEESSLYSDQYYSAWGHEENQDANFLPYWGLKKKYFSRLIQDSGVNLPDDAKALDIGCATGACLSVFSDLKLTPYGIEVNPYAIESSKKNVPNARLFMGNFEDRPGDMNDFSIIVMSDVIEHVADPTSLLESVYKCMLPGGLLVLVTPNIDSISHKLMGRKWPHYKPEHLFLFGEKGIGTIISKTGFGITTIRPAVKTLSPLYVLTYYEKYGGRFLSTLCRTIRKIFPDTFLNVSASFSIGEVRIYATK